MLKAHRSLGRVALVRGMKSNGATGQDGCRERLAHRKFKVVFFETVKQTV